MRVRHSASGKDGDPIPNVPELTYNIALELNQSFDSGLRGTAFANYTYTDQSASDFNPFLIAPAGTSGAELNQIGNVSGYRNPNYSDAQGDYGIFDLRFGLESEQRGWGIFLFIDNVFDERGITQVAFNGQLRGAPTYGFSERSRTIGLNFNKAFGLN